MDRRGRFDEAKFGLFVHWGAYTVEGVEASWPVMLGPELQRRFVEALHRFGVADVEMPPAEITLDEYEALPQRFDPAAFDAAAWVDLARDAGQRYLTLTTKHHDGFCLFDTATTDYSVARGPLGRDVVGEVAKACADGGIGFGAYFSAPDFHHPGYRDLSQPLPTNFLGQPERPEWAGFLDFMEAQVNELASCYGELFTWWWDIGFGPQWPIERFHAAVRDLQPAVLMNDRLGGLDPGLPRELAADFLTPEQSVPKSIPRWSTAGAPLDPTMLFALIQRDDWEEAVEQVAPILRAHFAAPADPSVPEAADFMPWEACHTFGGAWAWAPDITEYKSGADIVTNLVETASRGGNLLMNVGPKPDGSIQPEFQTALREVGRWFERNGRDGRDGIHATTYGPVQGREGYRTTADAHHVYVHLLEPRDVIEVPLTGVESVTVLRDGQSLDWRAEGPEMVVDVSRLAHDPVATTLSVTLT